MFFRRIPCSRACVLFMPFTVGYNPASAIQFRRRRGIVRKSIILGVAAVMVAGSLGVGAFAADGITQQVPVAQVDGMIIYQSDIDAAKAQFGAQVAQYPPLVIQQFILNNIIDARLGAQAARAQGIDKESAIKRRLERLNEQVLRQELVERAVAKGMSKDRLQAHYKEFVKQNPGRDEVHARHILVKTEGEAKTVIGQLDKGEDFATLAKQLSIGPSGKSGGDLGFFTADRMVAPFSVAAFQTKPGSHTTTPVKTQFGWHVIKVEAKRKGKPPSFDEAAPTLRESLRDEITGQQMELLRSKAKIVIYGPDGKPVP